MKGTGKGLFAFAAAAAELTNGLSTSLFNGPSHGTAWIPERKRHMSNAEAKLKGNEKLTRLETMQDQVGPFRSWHMINVPVPVLAKKDSVSVVAPSRRI